MAEQFQAGDIVQLKSGGMHMTVAEVDDDEVSCTWFDASSKLQSNDFAITVLKKVQAPEPDPFFARRR